MAIIDDDLGNLELLLRLAELGKVASDALSRAEGGVAITDNVTLIVLCNLELRGPQRPIEIVELTGMTSGGVAKVVSRLEKVGLVTRDHAAIKSDRRAVSVSLTDEGHTLTRDFARELGLCISGADALVKDIHRLLG